MWTALPAAVLLRPESLGSVKLASSDPQSTVRIFQNFIATDNEWATLRAGFRMLREFGRQGRSTLYRGRDCSGFACRSDAEIDAHIRVTAITVHHPLGTCKMGSTADHMAVVG